MPNKDLVLRRNYQLREEKHFKRTFGDIIACNLRCSHDSRETFVRLSHDVRQTVAYFNLLAMKLRSVLMLSYNRSCVLRDRASSEILLGVPLSQDDN